MIIASSVLFYLLFLLVTYFVKTKNLLKDKRILLPLFMFCGLYMRVVFSLISKGYGVDVGCFEAWSHRAASVFPQDFYSNSFFCDYPPLYLYIATLIGHLKPLIGGGNLVLFAPSIISDFLSALLIYKIARKKTSEKSSAIISGIYFLNPAIILNSSVWGQIDSILTLFLALSLFFLTRKKYFSSSFTFALAVLLKPQALLIAPIFIFAFIDALRHSVNRKKIIFDFLGSIVVFVCSFILISLPFIITKPPLFIFEKYISTLSSYAYCSLNALNVFSFFGLNGVPVSQTVNIISIFAIAFSVLASGFIILKSDKKSKYFLSSAMLLYGVFCFCAKMHERYLYPVILLLLISAVMDKNKKLLLSSIFLSLLHYVNVALVYEGSLKGSYYLSNYNFGLKLLSLSIILLFFYILFLTLKNQICRWDKAPLFTITLVYAVISFINLGSFTAPDDIYLKVSTGSQYEASEETYMSSMYFDEIYHARTAYEHINFIPHYETTHPPLGKLIIGLGIKVFGMTPFGWRFMGTLAGIIMLPVIYYLALTLFKKRSLAIASLIFMATDFMHITQTRLATIDSFVVLFIMLSYLFMSRFYINSKTCTIGYANVNLLLSGLFFGLASATKWSGVFSGAGLAILFFIALIGRVKEKSYKELLICLNCVLYFLVIPFIIYYIVYIPIHIADGSSDYLKSFIAYQKHMFGYHKNVFDTHPFSSEWYTWPWITRPIWYYGNSALAKSNITSSIVGLGNPFIWWLGTASLLPLLRKLKHPDALFIVIGFLSQYLPWAFVGRTAFIYHFFPSTPFIILSLVYLLQRLGKKALQIGILISVILFIMYYPILTGLPVDKSYVLSFLRLFENWVITY